MTPSTKPNDFLPNAPDALVELHSQVLREKDILRRLLTDQKMNRSWALIGQRCSGAQDYRRLWYEIVNALKKSRFPLRSRAKIRDDFLRIAKDAERAANTITKGPLDCLTYEFFPENELRVAFETDNWSVLRPDERGEVAHRYLAIWPTMTGLLEEFARRAKRHAKEIMTEKRTVDRDTHDRQFNHFVRHLARYFRKHLDGPMKGTLANIASVVFERDIDEKLVRQALSHEKGGA